MGRRVVTTVAVSLVLALIVRDGAVIQASVFDVPDVPLADRDCDAGIARLEAAYRPLWANLRDGVDAPALGRLDLELRALRARCLREGDTALTRFKRVERWRYRAENLARLWHDTLHSDPPGAERAAASTGANP